MNLSLGNARILSSFVLNPALSFKETEAMRKNTESHLVSTQKGPGGPESVPPKFAFQTAPSSSFPPLFLPGLDKSGTFYIWHDFNNCDYTPCVLWGLPTVAVEGLQVRVRVSSCT